jgi:hypothetical protein
LRDRQSYGSQSARDQSCVDHTKRPEELARTLVALFTAAPKRSGPSVDPQATDRARPHSHSLSGARQFPADRLQPDVVDGALSNMERHRPYFYERAV